MGNKVRLKQKHLEANAFHKRECKLKLRAHVTYGSVEKIMHSWKDKQTTMKLNIVLCVWITRSPSWGVMYSTSLNIACIQRDDSLLRLISFCNSKWLGLFSTFSKEIFDVELLKQSRRFVKYSSYCSAWMDRNNCQKKDESLIHWEGKQKPITNKKKMFFFLKKTFTLIFSPST